MRGFFVGVLCTLGLGTLAWDYLSGGISSTVIGNLLAKQPQVSTQTQVIEVKYLQNLFEVATIEYQTVSIGEAKEERNIPVLGNQTTATLSYLAVANVKAGVRLDQLKAEDILAQGNLIKVTLPAPEILNVTLNEQKSKVLASMTLIQSTSLEQQARQDAIAKIKEELCGSDLLAKANTQAKVAIANLLQGMAPEKSIDVIVTEPRPCSLPSSEPAQ